MRMKQATQLLPWQTTVMNTDRIRQDRLQIHLSRVSVCEAHGLSRGTMDCKQRLVLVLADKAVKPPKIFE